MRHLLQLSADFQRHPSQSSQLEAIYLVHVVLRWVFDVIAAGLAIWFLVLMVSLLAWAIWGLAWMVRRPWRTRAQPQQQPSAGMKGDRDG